MTKTVGTEEACSEPGAVEARQPYLQLKITFEPQPESPAEMSERIGAAGFPPLQDHVCWYVVIGGISEA